MRYGATRFDLPITKKGTLRRVFEKKWGMLSCRVLHRDWLRTYCTVHVLVLQVLRTRTAEDAMLHAFEKLKTIRRRYSKERKRVGSTQTAGNAAARTTAYLLLVPDQSRHGIIIIIIIIDRIDQCWTVITTNPPSLLYWMSSCRCSWPTYTKNSHWEG